MNEHIDPAAIMAEHYGHAHSCEFLFLTKQPGTCPEYRLAEALAAARAEITRLKEQNPWQVEWDTIDVIAEIGNDA